MEKRKETNISNFTGEDSSMEKIAGINFKMLPLFPSTVAKFCRLGKS